MIYVLHYEWFSEGMPETTGDLQEDKWIPSVVQCACKNNKKFDSDAFMDWQIKTFDIFDSVFSADEWRFVSEELITSLGEPVKNCFNNTNDKKGKPRQTKTRQPDCPSAKGDCPSDS